ncbi:MAG: hypothetical protein IPJ61_17495 [Tessaracoccus sp.]|uniref:helix-turn-helix transcriptional regulator n=1 Tax=Tessaracoccus sp. TaxID=1971211 RepID=UPI001ED293D4|nr:hypothetical protein [Tessaracoccus sp.]MBK7822801.1 hypothetical protein [Tessaracoccus sp.]
MIIEQGFAAGPTAWLAAVGLIHLSPAPMDPVDAFELASSLGRAPLVNSRWVRVGSTRQLEVDGPVAGFGRLLEWYELRFSRDLAEQPTPPEVVGRDPWWRTRGQASVHGLGAAIYSELVAIDHDVDIVAELCLGARVLSTSALAGWVIDRQWVTLETDEAPLKRPLIRYALAYIGATVAQHWPGHMVGSRAVGHLWDGQPDDHPLLDHTAITWEPIHDRTGHYPPWWGPGEYVTIPAARWANQARERWEDDWVRSEILGRTEASRAFPGRLPAPHLRRGAGPLWRRSLLELQAAAVSSPSGARASRAKAPGAPEVGDQPLDIAGVAEHTGLSVATLRSYQRDKTMPKADGSMGQSAWWWASTIDEWQDGRPPRGRPAKTPDDD